MATLRVASAYCPDVPRQREHRGCTLHGIAFEARGIGKTLCGLSCNEAEVICSGGHIPNWDKFCKRCLRNAQFFAAVQLLQVDR